MAGHCMREKKLRVICPSAGSNVRTDYSKCQYLSSFSLHHPSLLQSRALSYAPGQSCALHYVLLGEYAKRTRT